MTKQTAILVSFVGFVWAFGGASYAQAELAPTVPSKPVAPPPAAYQELKDQVREHESRLKVVKGDRDQIKKDSLENKRQKITTYYQGYADQLREKETHTAKLATSALESFIAQFPKDPDLTPYALLVLGQRYFAEEDARLSQAMDAPDNASNTAASANFSKTIGLSKRLIEQFPNYRMLDAAYYLLGICYLYEDRFADSINIWRTLVDKFPNSTFRDEALFRVGEDHFSARQLKEAAQSYQAIVNTPGSSFYDKALYKLAWTDYLLSRYDEAIAGFTKVLDYRTAKDAKGAGAGSVLEGESEQYLAISFADKDWGDVDDNGAAAAKAMQDYFKNLGPRLYERRVFVHLADLFAKVSKYQGAESAFAHAIALEASHPDNPELSLRIIKVLDEARLIPQSMAARKRLIVEYGPGSAWEKANGEAGRMEALEKARKLIRDEVMKLAIFEHARARSAQTEGRQDEAKALFQEASRTYLVYVKLFPGQDDVDKALYYLAEASYDAGWYADAAQAFKQTRDWPWSSEFRQRSALNAAYAYQQEVQRKQKLGLVPDFDLSSISPQNKAKFQGPPADSFNDFIASVDELNKRYPEMEELPAFMYQAAGIYYAYGDIAESNRRLDALVERHPKLETSRLAANLLLDDKLSRGDWAAAAKEAARFKGAQIGGVSQEFEKVELGARFKGVTQEFASAEAIFAQGKISDARAQYGKAADSYLALLKDDPKAEYADKMLYNAGVALDRAKRPEEASQIFQRLFNEYPKSPLAEVAMSQRAQQFEQTLEFDRAAQGYLRLAESFPKAENSSSAYLNAGLLYEADQDFLKAAKVFEQFSKQFPDRPEAAEAYIRAANLQAKAGNPAEKTRLLEAFVKKYRTQVSQRGAVVEANAVLGDAFAEAAAKAKGDNKKALLLKRRSAYADAATLSKGDESPKSIIYGSKAEFMLLEDEFDKYEDLKIKAPQGKQQGKELSAKTNRLSELKKSYEGLVRSRAGTEWTVGSLYQIGGLYEGLYRALLDAPCPKDVESVDEDACDEYRSLLEDKAFVLEEKALDSYRRAKENAGKIPNANRWAFKAEEAMNRMKPNDYPVPDRPLGEAIVTRDFVTKPNSVPAEGSAQ